MMRKGNKRMAVTKEDECSYYIRGLIKFIKELDSVSLRRIYHFARCLKEEE